MKKLLFLFPIALAAAAGAWWISTSHTVSPVQNPSATKILPHGGQALFTLCERSLRQIVRHGEYDSIGTLNTSLSAISDELAKRKKDGFSVDKIEQLLAQYQQDSTVLTQHFSPKMRELRLYDSVEQKNEKQFLTAIEQIGLYELKTACSELEKLRTEYIKKPSRESASAYHTQSEKMATIITELYLDSNIEAPMLAYLENHKLYFETIAGAYKEIGLERIHRLRTTGYAIKTELQLLPIL
ncbi:MAG: hypothetical protein JXK04_05915 [Campylobacterales bacterium]|nr:hypothetical protein [Campylobacterales bacterium]